MERDDAGIVFLPNQVSYFLIKITSCIHHFCIFEEQNHKIFAEMSTMCRACVAEKRVHWQIAIMPPFVKKKEYAIFT